MENRGPRSLAYLAQKACIKYLKRINDVGDCPYELIRPVLLKLESPDQLHQLEVASPQLIGRVGEIWLQLIKRDIPDWERKPHQPKDPKNWWKVYKKLKDQAQKERNQGAEKLKAALDSLEDEREQKLAKLVPRKDLPKEPVNQKARTSYLYGKTGARPGSKLSLLEKIRKQARNARLVRLQQPASLSTMKPTEIKRAPQALIEDCKRSIQQNVPAPATLRTPPAPRISRPPLASSRRDKPVNDKSLVEREERLRVLTGGKASTAAKMPQPNRVEVNHRPERTVHSQPLSKPRSRPQFPQYDGVDEEDLQDPPRTETHFAPKNPIFSPANSPPKHRLGTPSPSRFSTQSSPPKRKAEQSIFVSAKKARIAR